MIDFKRNQFEHRQAKLTSLCVWFENASKQNTQRIVTNKMKTTVFFSNMSPSTVV